MKWYHIILKRILSGVVFLLLPVVVMIFILGKAIDLVKLVIQPFKKYLPAEPVFGIGVLTLISLIIILLICYIAGILSEKKFLKSLIGNLEDKILVFIPGYAILKSRVGDAISETDDLQVVLVNEDNDWRPGIQVDKEENGYSSIFFPGPPAGRTGLLKIVHVSKIKVLDIPVVELMKVVRKYGQGSAALIKEEVGL